jgi:hypothetical protein
MQAIAALIALIVAAPFITNLLPVVQTPNITDVFLQLQTQWNVWLDLFSTLRLNSGQAFPLPSIPQLPTLEISSLVLTLTFVGVSVLWVLGNGLLLRKHIR